MWQWCPNSGSKKKNKDREAEEKLGFYQNKIEGYARSLMERTENMISNRRNDKDVDHRATSSKRSSDEASLIIVNQPTKRPKTSHPPIAGRLPFEEHLERTSENLVELEHIYNHLKEENGNLTNILHNKEKQIEMMKLKLAQARKESADYQERTKTIEELDKKVRKYDDLLRENRILQDEKAKLFWENTNLIQMKADVADQRKNEESENGRVRREHAYFKGICVDASNILKANYGTEVHLMDEIKRMVEDNARLKLEKDELLRENRILNGVEEHKRRQNQICDKVLRLLSLVSDFEGATKKEDVIKVNAKLVDLNRRLGIEYGKDVRDLNLEILRLVQALNDPETTQQYETFRRRFTAKTEEMQRTHSMVLVPYPSDLVRKFNDSLEASAREIQDELEAYRQVIFDFPSIEAQRRAEYKVLILGLVEEREWLRGLNRAKGSNSIRILKVGELPDEPYVKEMMARIHEIVESTSELEKRVAKFKGKITDKVFLDLEHKLLNNVIEIDKIQVDGHEEIRQARRDAVKYAYDCMDKLKENTTNVILENQ